PGGNQLARRVVDDLIEFSDHTSMDGYMNFLRLNKSLNLAVFDNPGEVFDTLMGLRNDVRVEQAKLMGLNELVTRVEEKIEMKEARLKVLSGMCSYVLRFAPMIGVYLGFCSYVVSVESAMKCLEHMRVIVAHDAVTLGELETLLGQGAVKCLEHMRVIVARDAVTLGELETLLGRAQVGVSLKAGFIADIDVKD
nr:hypothetical protein [Tanacetum cinerariifolium]